VRLVLSGLIENENIHKRRSALPIGRISNLKEVSNNFEPFTYTVTYSEHRMIYRTVVLCSFKSQMYPRQ